MAIKRKLSKEEFDKLPDALKTEYQEKDGNYVLILDGDDELRKAKDNEVSSHKETKQKLKDVQEQFDAFKAGKARTDGDINALEESWKGKLAEREKQLGDENTTFKNMLISSLRNSTLSDLASRLVKPEASRLFKKSLEDRISVDLSSGEPVIRILDAKGQPSAMGISDLEKEILASSEYSTIIIASKATGGAGTKAAGSGASEDKKPILAKMTPAELAAHFNTGE